MGLQKLLLAFSFALVVGLVIGAAGSYEVELEQSRIERAQHSEATRILDQYRAALESELNTTLYLTSGLVTYVSAHSTLDPLTINSMLKAIYGQGHHLRAISMAPGNRLRYVYPLAGNEKTVGIYYPQIPDQWPAVERVMRERQPRLAGPVHLKQGGIGFVYRVPVFLGPNGKYWGLLNTAIDQDSLFAAAKIAPEINGLQLALRGKDGTGAEGDVFMGNASLFESDSVKATIRTPGGDWQIAMRPSGGWAVDERLKLLQIGSWLAGVMVGLLVYFVLIKEFAKKAALVRLAEGEEKLRGLYELSHLGIALTDMKGRFIEFNDAFLRICGYSSAEELKELDYWTLTPKKYAANEALQLKSLERTGHYGPYEKEYQRKDGTLIPLRLNGMLITNNGQKFIWSIIEDITEHKLNQQRLVQSEQRMELALDGAELGMWDLDLESGRLDCNQHLHAMFGLPPDEQNIYIQSFLPLFHPDDANTLISAFNAHLKGSTSGFEGECRVRHKDGHWIWVLCRGKVVERNQSGRAIRIAGTNLDISERKANEAVIHDLAFYDPLTRLPNRRLLLDRLEQVMAASQRSSCYGALMFIDLDNFKPLNDKHGHAFGDLLLRKVANRLVRCVREVDTVARIGGDEFVVMLGELSADRAISTSQAELVAEKIRTTLSEPYLLRVKPAQSAEATVEHCCTASIGVALFIGYAASQDDILTRADDAMYEAKEAGRNLVRFASTSIEHDHSGGSVLANFVQLNWRTAYQSGNALIDEQHRDLLGDANRLVTAMLSGEPTDEIARLIDVLIGDIAQHFKDEESIISAAGFTGREEHAAIHKKLLETAANMTSRFQAGTLAVGDVLQFLVQDVIAQHMLKEDRKFFPYLMKERPAGKASS